MATMRVKKTRRRTHHARAVKANQLLVADQHRDVAQIHVTVSHRLPCDDVVHTHAHPHRRLPLVGVATIHRIMVDIHPDVDLIDDVLQIVIVVVHHLVVVDAIVMEDPDLVPVAIHLQDVVVVEELVHHVGRQRRNQPHRRSQHHQYNS